ncbi:MAG: iron-containing alcohol dehydrogenase [Desulfobacter sp.]|nr:MAG: iron-containing alcohol dehydrogenase [Desulfobacter sp.]
MTQFNGRTKICYGEDAMNVIETLPLKRALVVTDPFMTQIGFADRIISALDRARIPHSLFDRVEPDPSLETVTLGTHELVQAGADGIIALGGGSAIDAAKAMMYFAYKAMGEKDKPLLVVIPTTSGTGSEVTSFSVVTDTANQTKIPLSDELLIPDMAILDARFTRTVPPAITADTGMDVLTHAIEAFTSVDANIFADIYSEHAIRDVFKYLVRAYENGDDMRARERMMVASCMAGTAFSNCGLGICHSLAHALGGIFHIPHGKANAVMLPHAITFNTLEAGERYKTIAEMINLPASSVATGTKSLVLAVQSLNEHMNIPLRIRDLDIEEAEFKSALGDLSVKALEDPCSAYNPRKPSFEEIRHLFEQAW